MWFTDNSLIGIFRDTAINTFSLWIVRGIIEQNILETVTTYSEEILFFTFLFMTIVLSFIYTTVIFYEDYEKLKLNLYISFEQNRSNISVNEPTDIL